MGKRKEEIYYRAENYDVVLDKIWRRINDLELLTIYTSHLFLTYMNIMSAAFGGNKISDEALTKFKKCEEETRRVLKIVEDYRIELDRWEKEEREKMKRK